MDMIVTPAVPVTAPQAELKFAVTPRYTAKRTLRADSMIRGFSQALPNGNVLFRDPRTETYVEATITDKGVTLVADHGTNLDAARAALLPVTPRKARKDQAATPAPVSTPAPTSAPAPAASAAA